MATTTSSVVSSTAAKPVIAANVNGTPTKITFSTLDSSMIPVSHAGGQRIVVLVPVNSAGIPVTGIANKGITIKTDKNISIGGVSKPNMTNPMIVPLLSKLGISQIGLQTNVTSSIGQQIIFKQPAMPGTSKANANAKPATVTIPVTITKPLVVPKPTSPPATAVAPIQPKRRPMYIAKKRDLPKDAPKGSPIVPIGFQRPAKVQYPCRARQIVSHKRSVMYYLNTIYGL